MLKTFRRWLSSVLVGAGCRVLGGPNYLAVTIVLTELRHPEDPIDANMLLTVRGTPYENLRQYRVMSMVMAKHDEMMEDAAQ